MTLSARLVLVLNHLFPRVHLRGRKGKDDYSSTSYQFASEDAKGWIPLVGDWQGGAVVDVGCGFGGRTAYYAGGRRGPTIGVDLLRINTAQAARFARLQGLDGHTAPLIVQGNAERAPLRGQAFEAVVCTDCMEHFPDPRSALFEMWRLVRPGGCLVLEFSPSWVRTGSHLGDYVSIPWVQWFFSRQTLEEAAAEIHRRRQAVASNPEEASRQEEWFSFVMEIHRNYLNVMTHEQFFAWLQELQDASLRRLDQSHARTKGLSFLPVIGGMFAAGFTCVVERVPGRRIGRADLRRTRMADFRMWAESLFAGLLRRMRRTLGRTDPPWREQQPSPGGCS